MRTLGLQHQLQHAIAAVLDFPSNNFSVLINNIKLNALGTNSCYILETVNAFLCCLIPRCSKLRIRLAPSINHRS